jgi:hypothetical protein
VKSSRDSHRPNSPIGNKLVHHDRLDPTILWITDDIEFVSYYFDTNESASTLDGPTGHAIISQLTICSAHSVTSVTT